MWDEMAGTPSTSGSRACCHAAFFLPPGQSTPRWSPALTMVSSGAQYHTYARYVCTQYAYRPSCVNLVNSIKCVGDSRSYFSYCGSHYVLLTWTIHTQSWAAHREVHELFKAFWRPWESPEELVRRPLSPLVPIRKQLFMYTVNTCHSQIYSKILQSRLLSLGNIPMGQGNAQECRGTWY